MRTTLPLPHVAYLNAINVRVKERERERALARRDFLSLLCRGEPVIFLKNRALRVRTRGSRSTLISREFDLSRDRGLSGRISDLRGPTQISNGQNQEISLAARERERERENGLHRSIENSNSLDTSDR